MLEPRVRAYYSKVEGQLMIAWDPGADKALSRYLFHTAFNEEVLEELDRRGYDVTTIRFQIRKKPPGVLDQLARIE
jgi:hypothetical protein